jgi:hypothetical protein
MAEVLTVELLATRVEGLSLQHYFTADSHMKV